MRHSMTVVTGIAGTAAPTVGTLFGFDQHVTI
jgi:hypothetical protein